MAKIETLPSSTRGLIRGLLGYEAGNAPFRRQAGDPGGGQARVGMAETIRVYVGDLKELVTHPTLSTISAWASATKTYHHQILEMDPDRDRARALGYARSSFREGRWFIHEVGNTRNPDFEPLTERLVDRWVRVFAGIAGDDDVLRILHVPEAHVTALWWHRPPPRTPDMDFVMLVERSESPPWDTWSLDEPTPAGAGHQAEDAFLDRLRVLAAAAPLQGISNP